MLAGLCSIELHLTGVTSLKEKRRIIKSLVQRIRNRYNVSIAEVDHQDYWQSSCLGVACVSNERKQIDHVLQQVVRYVEQFSEAELIDFSIEML